MTTVTLKEALKQPDAEEFLKAMVKEVDDHVRREHWKIMTISEMISSVRASTFTMMSRSSARDSYVEKRPLLTITYCRTVR